MKVLYITNMYPHKENPYYGIFVKEQIDAISALNGTDGREIKSKTFFINGKSSTLNYLLSIFSINFHLCFNKYDVIHIHYGLSGLFLLFNFFLKTPVVVTFHGGDIQKERKRSVQNFISRKIARRSALTVVLNDSMEVAVKGISKKILQAPCGIDTDIFTEKSSSEYQDKYTVIFPSSSSIHVKNYPLFQKVVKSARKALNCQIDIIEIKGMTRVEVASVLNKADCLLMTSFSEGSPQIIKEAMACNVPIVSTNVGNVSDLLENVENCSIAKESTPEGLQHLLLKVLKSKKRSSNGRKKIFEMGLNSRSVAINIYRSYRDLMK